MTKEMIYEKAEQLAPGGTPLKDWSFEKAGKQEGIQPPTPEKESERPGVDKSLWKKSFEVSPPDAVDMEEPKKDRPGVKDSVLDFDETYSYNAEKK